jgi:putative tricarboxylic transport membrane protein
MLGALLGLNIAPGPLMIEQHPDVFWGLAASMYVGNLFLLVLNLPLVGLFVRILRVPRWFLMPAVAALSIVAVYAVNSSAFDLLLMTGFGVLGYLMRKTGFPLAPVILGLVLGPLLEKNLRRALALSGGDWDILFSSGLALLLWAAAALILVLPGLLARRSRFERIDPVAGEND